MQSRALLYLFTLTHSVMEAMAAAEQAIELATATTSMATACQTAAANATTATSTATTGAEPPAPAIRSQTALSSDSTLSAQSSPQSTAKEFNYSTDVGQHVQHGHMDPLQEALQLQHHSQTPMEEEGQEDDSQPLIAAPKGLLQVSLDQRPAKQYFDRSVFSVSYISPLMLCTLT